MSGEATPPLPAGFTIDSPSGDAASTTTPPLPPGFKLDASTQPILGAIAKGVKNQGRVVEDMQQHHAPVQKFGHLPFVQQSMLAAMDNPGESRALLEQIYGKGSVTSDKQGLIVKGKDGKPIRATSGFLASLVAEAPETILGIAGGVSGATAGGPFGAIAGAAVGAGAGKTIKEGVKAATDTYRKTPSAYVKQVAGAMEGGAIGEATGQTGKFAAKGIGRAWRWYEGITPEISSNTARYIAGGARPLPQYSLPDAKYIQRIYTLAEKISGPSAGMETANRQFMQGEVSKILTKAGLTTKAQTVAMASLEGTTAKISVTEAGRLVQDSAKSALMAFQKSALKPSGNTAKTIEYLKQLSATGITPEAAYTHLIHGGSDDMLEKFVGAMGKNSQSVQAIQHQALKDLLAESMIRTKDKGVVDSLTRGLKGMTNVQRDILFPKGLAKDIEQLDKDLHNIFPGRMDTSAAAITAGAILQRPLLGRVIHGSGDRTQIFHSRLAAQAYYGALRLILQRPTMIHTLSVGLRQGGKTRAAAKTALKELTYFGSIEASEPSQKEEESQR